ncbi:Protein KINESIN LIGHT CHAIN-RELATED 1 [Clonorchis sinensis]|uniref:Protein KINESIN LIGHT CHAIN-RELATED 1 n=1 Tax=Clonorchis sinensis TaxID=79923 RepID=A0A8T1M076_CLOSI|nr:Protein KINESIN LIGHT CHAIN-RELATED 1 [Clonorchis sinensis]
MLRQIKWTKVSSDIRPNENSMLCSLKRSCDIVDQLAEKINAKLLVGEGLNKPSKGSSPTSLSPQEYRVYAQLKFKSQTMVASTSLFVTVAECLMMVQQQRDQKQQELRKLTRENRELKADIAYSMEKIHDAEGKLAAAKEETSYWHLLCSLGQLDYELYLAEDDSESWYEPVRYDSLWNAEYAGSAGTEFNAIIAEVEYSSADELIKRINEKATPDIQDIPTYASLLELIARRFFEIDDFDSCSVLLDKVITMRRQTYTDTHPIIAATLVCLSITYGGQKKFREAQKLIGDALDLLKQHPEPERYREIIAGQYKRIGQKLISWGQPQAGIRVMQQSMRLLEDLLPKEETQWCDVINRMARICNDRGYFDDAMTLLCDVVDYYHGRQHGLYAARIPTIVEVAYAHQLAKHNPVLDLSNFSIPPSSLLSRPLVTALKEVGIAFACRNEFTASQIIAGYLNACSTASLCAQELAVLPLSIRKQSHVPNFLHPQLLRTASGKEPEKRSVRKSIVNFLRQRVLGRPASPHYHALSTAEEVFIRTESVMKHRFLKAVDTHAKVLIRAVTIYIFSLATHWQPAEENNHSATLTASKSD